MTRALHLWLGVTIAVVACEQRDEQQLAEDVPTRATFAIDDVALMERLERSFLAHEGRYWASHPTLRVEVDDGGTIAVHPSADGVPPMLLTTTSLGRDGGAAALGKVDVRRDGGLSIDRGTATEQLDVVDDGLEQSWRFEEIPDGEGDLVVRVYVDGYDWASEGDDGHHFVESNSGVGLVYGVATWVDADGVRTDVDVRREGEELVLTVPDEVVDDSAFPAVLDPIVFDPLPIIATSGNQHESASAWGIGKYLVVWRHGTGDIRGAFVNADGTRDGLSSFSIAAGAPVQTQPDVAFDGVRFVVVWTQDGNIRGARVTTAGAVLDGAGFDISVAAGTQNEPSIACKTGSCMAVWSDGRVPINLEIRGRGLTGGLPVGADFTVSNGAPGDELSPDIVFATSQYYVAWTDERVDADVYGTRVTDAGVALDPGGDAIETTHWSQGPQVAAIGSTVLVGWTQKMFPAETPWSVRVRRVDAVSSAMLDAAPLDAGAASTGDTPSVASIETAFAVAWNEGVGLAGRRIGADGIWDDAAPVDLHSPETMGQASTALASTGDDYLLTWNDVRDSVAGLDVYGAAVSGTLTRSAEDDTLITPTPGALNQQSPALAWNGTDYLIVWEDRRRGNADIVGAIVDHLGLLSHPVFIVADESTAETLPDVAWGGGSWLVSWSRLDLVAGTGDLFAVRVTSDADVLDPPVAISTAAMNQQRPAIVWDGMRFVVAFEDTASGNLDIRAARLDANANVLDPFGVLVAGGVAVQQQPDIAVSGGQSFIVWRHDNRLHGTGFTTDGIVLVPSGVNLTGSVNQTQDQPAIASHGTNELMLVWRQTDRIRGRKFLGTGLPVAPMFNIGSGAPAESQPDVVSDGYHYAVVWRDAGGAGDVEGVLLDDGGTPHLGSAYSIATTAVVEDMPAIGAAAPGAFLALFRGAVFGGGTLVQGTTLGNDCCAGVPPSSHPGCLDPEIVDCVCNTLGDDWCCTTGWDEICLLEAQDPMCGLVCP